jgi:hypothetical protein
MNNQQKFQLWSQALEAVSRFLVQLPKWGSICLLGYFGFRCVGLLAGKETVAQFGLFLMADLKASKVFSHMVSWAVGAGGVTYGIREKKLRQTSIKRLTARSKEWETMRDPRRSSSGLTEIGTTRNEDRE